jgi:1-acyl-sn-glycerol-3-phosphate acyltransferase
MGMENFNNPNKSQSPEKKGPSRFWLANEAMVIKTLVGKIETSGEENIKKLPPGAKVVVLTTHLTDLDMPIVIHAVGKDLDMVEMDMSTHHKMFGKQGEAITNIGLHLAGKNKFLPIDYTKDASGKKSPRAFNPENFSPAVEAIDKGKAVMIAAHNPSLKPEKNLDNVKGGYGGVYLAELANAYILPVTVVLDKEAGMYGEQTKALKEKPNASVVIGEPFQLEKIDGLEHLSELTKKKDWNDKDFEEFSKLNKALSERSQSIIDKMSKQVS